MGLAPGQLLIAEAKPVSPFGYRAERSWDELFSLADEHGDWVSVHTDERWGGSFDLLERARARTNKTLLAKGIHETDEQLERAFAAGADFALVVGRMPGVYVEKCLVEPNRLEELVVFAGAGMARGVWNSRDLETGGNKDVTFQQARRLWGGWLCQASNIRTVDDVHPAANAVLVGTHLQEFTESLN